ncbi:MAG: glycosyltransferase [Candidatus Omnitrophica bacterium]|nr:glycosyltransferase [Candidatus Omnitrophota bacterium]
MDPRVSVIIPVYENEQTIAEAIESVLQQEFSDFEIIIIDDGSTDGSKDIIELYRKRSPDKIKCIRQSNQGISAARNNGIRIARGEYIAFLDADDLWIPEKLKTQVLFMDKEKNLGFSYTETFVVDIDCQLTGHWKHINPTNTFEVLYNGNFIHTLTVMARRHCFDRVGLFDPHLAISQDYHMWLKLTKQFSFGHISQPLAKYRIHSNNTSKDHSLRLKDHLYIISNKETAYDIPFWKQLLRKAKTYIDFGEIFRRENKLFELSKCYIMASIMCPWIGAYYWPKEAEKMRFSIFYRIFKIYFLGIYYFLSGIKMRLFKKQKNHA